MTTFVNLTPHSLGICDAEGKVFATIPSTGTVRVATSAKEVNYVYVDEKLVSIVETTYGAVEGLPAPAKDTVYVVSILVIAALKAANIVRPDVVAPDTGPASVVRDATGQILGVKRFTR
jgi:hypothetical protein